MKITASDKERDGDGGGDGKPMFPPGPMAVTCCDIVDRGMLPNLFAGEDKGLRHVVRFVFATAKKRKDGDPITLNKDFTLSLHKKSSLRAFLQSWTSTTFVDGQEVDLETFIGLPAFVGIVHNPSRKDPSKVWANIGSIMALPVGMDAPDISGYIRTNGASTLKDDVLQVQINPAQIAKWKATCRELNVSEQEEKAMLSMFNITSIKDCPENDYDAIFHDLRAMKGPRMIVS